ncbi:MAG TPA: hypothetical protein VGC54_09135 [Planctomycetota bacterium]
MPRNARHLSILFLGGLSAAALFGCQTVDRSSASADEVQHQEVRHLASPDARTNPGVDLPDWMQSQEHEVAGLPRWVKSRPFAGGQVLALETDRSWEWVEPSSSMRLAEFRMPGPEGFDAGSLVIFWFDGGGGTVDANLRRWADQFDAGNGVDPLLAADITMVGATGSKLTRMQLEGRFIAPTAPGSAQNFDRPGWAMDATVFETTFGPVFLKATGPAPTLRLYKGSLDRLFSNLRVETRN